MQFWIFNKSCEEYDMDARHCCSLHWTFQGTCVEYSLEEQLLWTKSGEEKKIMQVPRIYKQLQKSYTIFKPLIYLRS